MLLLREDRKMEKEAEGREVLGNRTLAISKSKSPFLKSTVIRNIKVTIPSPRRYGLRKYRP